MTEPARSAARPDAVLGVRDAASPRRAPRARSHEAIAKELQRTRGNSATARLLGQPGAARAGTGIRGPLAPGAQRRDGELVVEQHDARAVTITYRKSRAEIRAGATDGYAFEVEASGPGDAPDATGFVALEAVVGLPALPQRVVRLSATSGVQVEWQTDEQASVPPLVVHHRVVTRREEVANDLGGGLLDPSQVVELCGDTFATLQLDRSSIGIRTPDGRSRRRPFAYSVDPSWTGGQGLERRVCVVAGPGVEVSESEHDLPIARGAGRRLVLELVRVPHVDLVPPQGTRFTAGDFVGAETVQPGRPPAFPGLAREESRPDRLTVATGLAGATITHPWSGAQLSLRAVSRESGAAYAYQVLAPSPRRPGEIRAVVGPGVEVELVEPLPRRLDTEGVTPAPLPGATHAGEGLGEQGIRLTLVEVWDAALVPPLGVPLDMDRHLGHGRMRTPDVHRFIDTSELATELGTAAADVLVGMIPVVGDLADIGELLYAVRTDRDRWGRPVTYAEKVLMGYGALIGLIPLVGGIGTVMRRGLRATSRLDETARRVKRTPEQLESTLLRLREIASPQDDALVRRVLDARRTGADTASADVARVEQILSGLGMATGGIVRGPRALTPTAESVTFASESAARSATRDPAYLHELARAVRSTGDVPDRLVEPLARSGAFASGEETAALIKQGLKDHPDTDFDLKLVEHVGDRTGAKVDAILQVETQTRRVHVSRPDLLARYEELANARMRGVVGEVLERQRKNPARERLKQLGDEFASFRSEVGDAPALTPAQRERAMEILREARGLARRDFANVQRGIMRRLRKDPQLRALEDQLRKAGDISQDKTGGIRVRTRHKKTHEITYEPVNVEHLTRLSDDPWSYNTPKNLLLTDAAQNQQHLETLRQYGKVWPGRSNDVERFVITHGLHDQNVAFAPGSPLPNE